MLHFCTTRARHAFCFPSGVNFRKSRSRLLIRTQFCQHFPNWLSFSTRASFHISSCVVYVCFARGRSCQRTRIIIVLNLPHSLAVLQIYKQKARVVSDLMDLWRDVVAIKTFPNILIKTFASRYLYKTDVYV